jgi:processive 1,2-diacylglycerol beta-glucosyltransferase
VKRVLIVSASAGAGHVRAGAALEAAFRARHPEVEARHVDILDFTSPTFKKLYARSYLAMVNHVPALWGYFYEQLDRRVVDRRKAKIVSVFDRIQYKRFRDLVEAFAPDVLLGTHFLPAEILGSPRRHAGLRVPIVLVVTDYDIHAFWVHASVARYFVGSDEVRARLVSRGIAAERVVVSGIPIDPVFSTEPDRRAIRARLGIEAGRFTVLLMSGGLGVKGIDATVSEIVRIPGPLQVLAVCGRNEKALEEMGTLRPATGVTLRAFGFVENIHELMSVADVAVTKSGGLSVSECLARKLPMIVWSPIPGQEERNSDYLLEAGAAWKAVDLDSLRYKLALLRERPDLLKPMRARAAAIARPGAAFAIAESVVASIDS